MSAPRPLTLAGVSALAAAALLGSADAVYAQDFGANITSSRRSLLALAGVSALATAALVGSAGAVLYAQNVGEKVTSLRVLQLLTNSWSGPLFKYLLRPSLRAVSVVDQPQHVTAVPPQLLTKHFVSLTELRLAGNNIAHIPDSIVLLVNLRTLDLSRNALSMLPDAIGKLSELVDLNLGHNCITTVSSAVGRLTQLQFLNLMANQISELPDSIGQLSSLYRLGLKSNKLKQLPESFGGCVSLVELFITDNELVGLPHSMGQLAALVKLQASFNKLRSLPPEMGHLPQLEFLRVAVNELADIPASFSGLDKLAWFSVGGNPACAAAQPPQHKIDTIKWDELSTAEVLGEGASGEVFAGEWRGQQVAVKVFKSDVSPDGQAQDEINVALFVDQKNLTRVLAAVEEPKALVKERVYGVSMAAKPNFTSLLRCRWAPDSSFALRWVVRVALSVAQALEYMHARRICHGDIYAHNVLVDDEGNGVLCDYGASFFYNLDSVPYQKWEVRAWGLMLYDLVVRLETGTPLEAAEKLRQLVDDCILTCTAVRPTFSDIIGRLHGVCPDA